MFYKLSIILIYITFTKKGPFLLILKALRAFMTFKQLFSALTFCFYLFAAWVFKMLLRMYKQIYLQKTFKCSAMLLKAR